MTVNVWLKKLNGMTRVTENAEISVLEEKGGNGWTDRLAEKGQWDRIKG